MGRKIQKEELQNWVEGRKEMDSGGWSPLRTVCLDLSSQHFVFQSSLSSNWLILGILAFSTRCTRPTLCSLYQDQIQHLTVGLLLILSFMVLGESVGKAKLYFYLLGDSKWV